MSETKPVTLAGWTKNKRHLVTLPSSSVIAIELPDLPEMLAGGDIPNELVDAAVSAAAGERKATKEDMQKNAQFYRFLVIQTVKEPVLTEEVLKQVPAEDKELIAAIALRQRDVDAVGDHIAGLHKSEKWRKFRGLDYGDEALEDA
jgi:hypothetical protein